MFISDLNLTNFRNYKKINIKFKNKINIIIGDNGQGKTNLLESIYVLGMTKSHRSFIDSNLIKNNYDYANIYGKLVKNNIKTKLEINLSNKNKILKIDNDKINKNSEYISKLNIIIFYPEDLELIKGSPQTRRRFLNLELSQLNSNYYIILNEYNKLLKMRNDYLKNDYIDINYLKIITDYMIEKEIIIYKLRKKFIDKLNENLENIFFDITSIKKFKIKYKSFIDINLNSNEEIKIYLKEKYEKIYNQEIKFKSTLLGPHRDDFEFYLDNLNLKNYGSQGQQRIAIISLKLSEIPIFKKYIGYNPILLLDDVFSELDENKKNNLLKYINNDQQVIITSTDLNNIDNKIIKKANIIKIKNGNVI